MLSATALIFCTYWRRLRLHLFLETLFIEARVEGIEVLFIELVGDDLVHRLIERNIVQVCFAILLRNTV